MKRLFVLLAILGGVFFAGSVVYPYTADGDISDWGVNISDNTYTADGVHFGPSSVGYFDAHTPTTTNFYRTEDNAAGYDHLLDGNLTSTWYVGPAYSTYNRVDGEAMYFNYDATNIYVAVVTGASPFANREDIGDLFLDTGKYQTSTSFVTTDLGTFNPAEAGNTHTGLKDHEFEYAMHVYDINATSLTTPALYHLDEFTITSAAGYPNDPGWTWAGPDGILGTGDDVVVPPNSHPIVGTEATGEPTALQGNPADVGTSLRYGDAFYQAQSALADPWAIHYSNYMAYVNDFNSGTFDANGRVGSVSTQLTIDPSVTNITPVGLAFAAGQIGSLTGDSAHYLYEFQIPMTAIGWDPSQPLWMHWVTECGNDPVELIFAPTIVPEPATVTLLGLSLLGFAGFRSRKKTRIG